MIISTQILKPTKSILMIRFTKYYIFLSVVLAAFIISCNTLDEKKTDEKKLIEIKSIVIGEQTWSAENINISHFQNGDSIPEAKTEDDWIKAAQENKPIWSYYNFDKKYEKQYGKLYNWYAITDPRGFAPKGWRVSSLNDWNILLNKCGGPDLAANNLKMKGGSFWEKTNADINNENNFSALPGGFYEAFGENGFWSIGRVGMWWTSDASIENNNSSAAFMMSSDEEYSSKVTFSEERKSSGLSVRFVADKNVEENKQNAEDGIITKVMTYKWCECNDGCASLFVDENGREYNFGNPSTQSVQFDCSMDKISDINKDKIFRIKFKEYPNDDYSILEITAIENESQTTCTICGTKFSGNGYEEVSSGVWSPCDSHSFSMICSENCGLKHTDKMNGIINSLPDKNSNEDYFSKERAKMRRQGYTEGEINQMRDPNQGDPEIKESAKRVFDAIKKQNQ